MSKLENAEWLLSFKASPITRRHRHGTINRRKPKRPKDFFGNNKFCIDCPSTNLTKHHLTRKEKRLLKISVEAKAWIWLCRKCHEKRHGVKPRRTNREHGVKAAYLPPERIMTVLRREQEILVRTQVLPPSHRSSKWF